MTDDGPGQEITPAVLRELAGEAEALVARIRAAEERLRRDPEDSNRAGYRLPDAAGRLLDVASDLHETAGDVARARVARDPRLCGIPWGICPDHGNTLRGLGGRTWCTAPGCSRRWAYDRLGTPCQETITHTVTDTPGTELLACDGHAKDAAARLDGATVDPRKAAP